MWKAGTCTDPTPRSRPSARHAVRSNATAVPPLNMSQSIHRAPFATRLHGHEPHLPRARERARSGLRAFLHHEGCRRRGRRTRRTAASSCAGTIVYAFRQRHPRVHAEMRCKPRLPPRSRERGLDPRNRRLRRVQAEQRARVRPRRGDRRRDAGHRLPEIDHATARANEWRRTRHRDVATDELLARWIRCKPPIGCC